MPTSSLQLHNILTNFVKKKLNFIYRATAMAVGSMFGRLGSVTFAYILGLLLDYHCREAFVITFVMFISKCKFSSVRDSNSILIFRFSLWLSSNFHSKYT